jgi:hypothetical protein
MVLLLTLATAVAFAAGPSGTPAEALLVRIGNEGGQAVLSDLWEHEPDFERVLAGVESGDATWLRVASALRPFSDAGGSLSLDYAVARALPRVPERVLGLVGRGFALQRICTSPFIEPAPGVAEAYEQKTLRALSKVKSPALASIAAQCAERVRLPAQ